MGMKLTCGSDLECAHLSLPHDAHGVTQHMMQVRCQQPEPDSWTSNNKPDLDSCVDIISAQS